MEGFRHYGTVLAVLLQTLFASAQTQTIPQTPENDLQQRYNAARAYVTTGDQERAAAEFRSFLAQGFHVLANAEADVGDFEAAQKFFTESLSFVPKDTAVLLDRAAAYLAERKLSQAKMAAARAIELEPENLQATRVLVRILFQQNDFAEARCNGVCSASNQPFKSNTTAKTSEPKNKTRNT